MKFIKNNKLLVSLFLAVFLVGVIVAVLTTAKNVPGMSKYTERAYYDLPKGQLPAPTMTPQEQIKRHSEQGFIDPIYRERLKEARGGVPIPSDILPSAGAMPGDIDKKFGNIGTPVIPGYGEAPKDSYDELYREGSPYKMWGHPGRIGEMMKKIASDAENKDKEPVSSVDAQGIKNDPSIKPFGSVDVRGGDSDKFKNALFKIFRVIEAAKDASEGKDEKPVEGKLEKDTKDKPAEKSTKK